MATFLCAPATASALSASTKYATASFSASEYEGSAQASLESPSMSLATANTDSTSTLKPGNKTEVACMPGTNSPWTRYLWPSRVSTVIRCSCGSTIQYSEIP